MAITTTLSSTEASFAEWVSAFVIPHHYAYTSALQHSRREDMTNKPSKVASWPVAPSITAGGLTEGVDATATSINITSQVQATIAEVGIAAELTDLLMASDIFGSEDWYAKQMQQAQDVKVNTDTTALFTGFATIVGGGAAASETNLLDAINKLEQANSPTPYVAVIKAKNLGDLRKDLAQTGGAPSAARFGQVPDIAGQTNPYGPAGAGYTFSHFGVDIFQDNTVTTTDAGVNNGNAVYSADYALGYAWKWQNRMEFQRRAVGRSTSLVLSTAKAEAELKDVAGVLWKASV